ncbi:MAG: 4-hydroxy-tetrahydrodipicolinate synthase [Clostridia bacterium]|nr:4-hydroxy-tetrahydrodipicolinate synthase [Clostridia bacterium]
MSLFSGVGVAMVTPVNEQGIIYSEVDKILAHVTNGGVNAIIALGTTGEAATLTENQKEDFVRYIRAHTNLPLIVGTGSNNTEIATKNCINAHKWGADGCLVVTPFYNKCTQNGAISHYRYVSERTKLPIIVYNVPTRTGFNLLPETMEKIMKLNNVVGIKEASGNMAQIEQCLRLNIPVWCGDDALTVPCVCMGGQGVISVAANVTPCLMGQMTDLARYGKTADASAIQLKLLPLIDALFCEVNPIPVRAALEFMGISVGQPRLPLTELSEQNKEKLYNVMKELNLI